MKAIVTVVGQDTVGIIAKVSTFLAESKVNILDISQTIMGETFTMIMMVDTSLSEKSFDELNAGLNKVGEELGVNIIIQNQKLFSAMHRI
ncbi:MAG: ACT domain-containing protein [Clostridia bacterium]|nr:ACT domain-containing protein [Clostridia bacterium]